MTRIRFITADGETRNVQADTGRTLMQVAVDNGIAGILGSCGGCCVCGTCHAYVDPEWVERLPPPSVEEKQTLEGASDLRENSRLLCQVVVEPGLDGIVLRIP